MILLEKYEKELNEINERAKKDVESYSKAAAVCKAYIFDDSNGFLSCYNDNETCLDNLPSISDLVSLRNGFLYSFNESERYGSVRTIDRIKNLYDNTTARIDKSKRLLKDIINDEPKVYKAIEDICSVEKRVLSGISDDDLSISSNKPYLPKSKYFETSNPFYRRNSINVVDKDYKTVDLYSKYGDDNCKYIVRRNGNYSLIKVVNKLKRRVNKCTELIRFLTSEINNIDNIFNSKLSKELNKDLDKSKTVYKIAVEEVKSTIIRLKSRYNSLLSHELIKNNIIDGVL